MAKAKTVSKADLVDKVSNDTGMKKKDVKSVMDAMIDQIGHAFRPRLQSAAHGLWYLRST